MKINVGNWDRIIRVVLAVVCAVLYFTGVVKGAWGIVLLIFGGAMLITAAVGFCGLYSLLGVNTCPVKEAKPSKQ
jgi:hypothetical protein